MVTKGWFRVFMGVIRLSASSVSIFFSRSMNSLRSAFSARMSVPSRFVMLTYGETGRLESAKVLVWCAVHTAGRQPTKTVGAFWK